MRDRPTVDTLIRKEAEHMADQRREVGPDRRILRREARANSTYRAFLKNLCRLGSMSEEFAEQAAVSVLCTLEQRLAGDEARHLEAQLPLRLQNLLVRCDRHQSSEPERFGSDEFLARVGKDLGMMPDEAEPVVRAVFAAIREQITEGEAEDVMAQLPRDLGELWQRTI